MDVNRALGQRMSCGIKVSVTFCTFVVLFAGCRPQGGPAQSTQRQRCPKDMAQVPGMRICIDRYEASFLPADVDRKAAQSLANAQPATLISWHQAQAACQGSHKRLCTKIEWQAACSGASAKAAKKRRYPYGDTYQKAICWDRPRSQKFHHQGPSATGTAPGCVTAENVYDLSGNVWEWIADRGPNGEPAFMLGSGSNNDSKSKLACDPGKNIGQPSHSKAGGLGFRCCKDL